MNIVNWGNTKFYLKSLKRTEYSQILCQDGRIILKVYPKKVGSEDGLDSTGLLQNPVMGPVNMVVTFQCHKRLGSS